MQKREESPFSLPEEGLSLYVHVPFCERKCNYCSFESHVPSPGELDEWLEFVKTEMSWWNSRMGRAGVNTLYFGGGTPTILPAAHWQKLFEIIDEYFSVAGGAEVTVEANPNSLDAAHLIAWRDWCVTRVSVGVQSFDDGELACMGRLHSAGEAYQAISASLASGFNVSLDLIFGLPGQTVHGWGRTLKDAVRSGVHHISLYQLSIEPGTPWENINRSLLPDGYAHYRWAQWYLPRRGFSQYEISNFAKPGFESRHNINYWKEGCYLGIGPGASGYVGGWRYRSVGNMREYVRILGDGRLPIAYGERLTKDERAREAAVLALRTADGISCGDYINKYGESAFQRLLSVLSGIPDDMYSAGDDKITLSPKGMRLANIIWAEIV